jgi:multidrug efflux pump subunit AcrA (membrane-fusion protein)
LSGRSVALLRANLDDCTSEGRLISHGNCTTPIFSNADFGLFPNQFVNTRLLVQTLEGVTLIPSATIQQNGQTSFVYVIQDNVAHLQNVKPGVTDNGLTQVEGINPGRCRCE